MTHDIKTYSSEADQCPNAPLCFKYTLFASLLVFIFSVFFASQKALYHFLNNGTHENRIVEIAGFRRKIQETDQKSEHIKELTEFYDAQQKWLENNYSASRLWVSVFKALPETMPLEGAKLSSQAPNQWFLVLKAQPRKGVNLERELASFSQKVLKESLSFHPNGLEGTTKGNVFEGTLTKS